MKLKFNLYVSDPEAFLKDPTSAHGYAIETAGCRHMDDIWHFVCEFSIDTIINKDVVTLKVIDNIDKKIEDLHVAIEIAEKKKAEFLALPSGGQVNE